MASSQIFKKFWVFWGCSIIRIAAIYSGLLFVVLLKGTKPERFAYRRLTGEGFD